MVSPLRSVSTRVPGLRRSCAVSPDISPSIPASSLAFITSASSSPTVQTNFCSREVSMLVAVKVSVPAAASASKSTPFSGSRGASSDATAAAFWTALNSSARFIVMFKISSFTRQSRRG